MSLNERVKLFIAKGGILGASPVASGKIGALAGSPVILLIVIQDCFKVDFMVAQV